MGVGPSMGKVLRSMEDEELIGMIQEAYRLDPTRMDKLLTTAKHRYLATIANHGAAGSRATPNTITCTPAPHLMATCSSSSSLSSFSSAMLDSKDVTSTTLRLGLDVNARTSEPSPPMPPPPPPPPPPSSSSSSIGPVTATTATTTTIAASTSRAIKAQTDALWKFDGHTLRELQPACNQPPKTDTNGSLNQVDEDGHLILYGNGGRDKRYARCSVCYFRGLRCNSAHYCASCQRAVCIRPRIYPGEDQPKICWNVLHMDKDMICRVQKRKKRRAVLGVEEDTHRLITSNTGIASTTVPSPVSLTPTMNMTTTSTSPAFVSSVSARFGGSASNAVVAAAEAIAAASYANPTTSYVHPFREAP